MTTESAGSLLTEGQVLAGSFRIVRKIGTGGMSEVYLAEDANLHVTVAVKVPTLPMLLSEGGRERFLREARMSAKLRGGPHIVRVYSCLTDPDFVYAAGPAGGDVAIPFIVMDYLEGGSLADRLEAGPFPILDAFEVFTKVCLALQYSHSLSFEHEGSMRRGIVHRDIKPENICFTKGGELYLVDFGTARNFDNPATLATVIGTPYYMPPEQWDPQAPHDHRVDIYALGVLLFRMLTGRFPFEGKRIDEIMAAQLFHTPPNPLTIRRDIPVGVGDAILRALEKEPSARFVSVEEFSRVIRRAADELTAETEVIRNTSPRVPRAIDERAALRHHFAGDALARKGQFDEAIREYDVAIELNPLNANAFINRGFCYYNKKLYVRATAEYSHAIELEPTNAEAWNNRGMIWLELGQYPNAIHDFRQAIVHDPGHPLAPNNLMNAQQKMAGLE